MAGYREQAPAEGRTDYHRLWRAHKRGFGCFSAFDAFHDRLTQGGFRVLRNRFRLRTLSWWRGSEPVLMATLFEAAPGFPGSTLPSSIGAFAASADLRPEEAAAFWERVRVRHEGRRIVTPMNGHHYLGFALPPIGADAARVGFQTAAPHAGQETLFGLLRAREPYRHYLAMETELTPPLLSQLEQEVREPPPGIRVRGFRPWAARRDFAILNELVNTCFTRHFDFAPLTEEENWDIFRYSTPLLPRAHLLFLEHEGRPIGFCLGMRDYNRVLTNGSDAGNLLRLALKRPDRGRLIHIGILPEYQGQGLIKQVRHRILLAFAREGIRTVENSYMDEGNTNSLGNVRSTGAQPLHTFSLLNVTEG